MTTTPFTAFIALVLYDQKIHEFLLGINKLKEQQETAKKQIENLHILVDRARDLVISTKKMIDRQERELRDIEQQIIQKKNKLDTVKNNKEYTSIAHELEQLEPIKIKLEESLIALWDQGVEAQEQYEKQHKQQDQFINTLQQDYDTNAQQISQKQETYKQMVVQREQHIALIPVDWLENYERMRQQMPDPVVPVIQNVCSACSCQPSGHDLGALKRHVLLPCKYCYRLLYIPLEH